MVKTRRDWGVLVPSFLAASRLPYYACFIDLLSSKKNKRLHVVRRKVHNIVNLISLSTDQGD